MAVDLPEDIDFAVCLTHDVDRPYKTYQSLYYATKERPLYHLGTLLPGDRSYWQFDEMMALESDLGVRSALYFLDEPSQLRVRPLRDLLRAKHLTNHLGRYDVDAPEVRAVVRRLDAGGWEVGVHGSSTSYRDPERLRAEKRVVEGVLGGPVRGIRQHYLHLDVPRTWAYQARAGFAYDTSLGSSTDYGFDHGYRPRRPFDDGFVVFPLTLMEQALPEPATRFADARQVCERLVREAADNGAVMTVLWHPRYFNEDEFPGYRRLYRILVEEALHLGGWVGPPGDLYDRLEWEGTDPTGDPTDRPTNRTDRPTNRSTDGRGSTETMRRTIPDTDDRRHGGGAR
jgi:hypothetical protein